MYECSHSLTRGEAEAKTAWLKSVTMLSWRQYESHHLHHTQRHTRDSRIRDATGVTFT